MPCYYPLQGWRSEERSANGGRQVVFRRRAGYSDRPIDVPCGQCLGCRLDNAREWAIRCVHEARMHELNSFVTLTYRDEDLPEDMSVSVREFQLFMKRLRKRFGQGIRHFGCGEYGEKTGRPHYHVLLFGLDFSDKKFLKRTDYGDLYTSKALESIWTKGNSSIGTVTFQSAGYTARYTLKKQSEEVFQHVWIDPVSGQVFPREREFGTKSKGRNGSGGIGAPYVRKYWKELLRDDFVVVDGKKMSLPRYYCKLLAEMQELQGEDLKKLSKNRTARVRKARRHAGNNTSGRHRVRETVLKARTTRLKREL